ncbi:reverse transcriptase domain-containing protein [Tanacetum coccineum]
MHTRASNSELVEPLLEPERTLNRRRRRQNRRVPFDQRNNQPNNPRIVYPPILDINHFRQFLVTLETLYPMDDKPMWAADCVVALTPGSAITIPKTANEFAIKGNAPKLSWSQSVQRQHYQNLLSWSKRNNSRSTECHSWRLADRSFQYPVGIAKNMLVEVGKFTFPADFIILKMEENSKVPLILGRPFLHTADAVI